MTWQRILCPTDINDASIEALRTASELCLSASASLYVLHIIEDLVVPGMGVQLSFGREIPRSEYQSERKKIKQLLQQHISKSVTAHILVDRGEAAEQIVHEAVTRSIDLIVLSRSKRNIVEELLFPSVADTVFRHAPCPVLLVPRRQETRTHRKKRHLLQKHQWVKQ